MPLPDSTRFHREKSMIRQLAAELSEIAHLPVQQKKIDLWKSLNSLKMKRPMVMVYAFPWEETEATCPELQLQAEDPFHRKLEQHLRRLLFKWRYMRADMVIQPIYFSPIYFEDTGIRMSGGSNQRMLRSYSANIHTVDIGNPHQATAYKPVLRNAEDIGRILMPEIRINHAQTDEEFERSSELLEPVLKVEKCGVKNLPFSPMDTLLEHWGINELMIDMIEQPELIHLAMDKLVDTYISRLEQFEKLNLLSLNHSTAGAITQGMGECLTDELPGPNFNPGFVKPENMWGGGTAQIMSGVSPAMHDEFCLTHERRWLEQFGLTAYGCCEPLHQKVDILRSIKNLRKISMSSWIQADEAAARIGSDYVFSYKPRPTFLAMDNFDLEPSRREIGNVLQQTRQYGCPVEFILRTIITYRSDPNRLAEWVRMAMAMVGAEE